MKRGDFKDLTSMIRAVIVMFVILSIAGATMLWAENQKDIGKCEYSVAANDKLQNLRINCPAPYEEITAKNSYDLSKGIATHLKSCWRKLGQGDKAPFGKEFMGASDYCIVCSEFTIPQSEKFGLKVPYLVQFLSTETIDESDMYYTDFLDVGVKKWYNENEKVREVADEQIFKFVEEGELKKDGKVVGKGIKSAVPSVLGEGIKDIHYVIVYVRKTSFVNSWVGGASWFVFSNVLGPVLSDDWMKEVEKRIDDKGYHMLYMIDEDKLDELSCDYVYWQKDDE